MTEDLEPCPFCKSVTSFDMSWNRDDDIITTAACRDENCPVRPQISLESPHNVEIVVKQWNTRPIEDALRAENQRLREALSYLLEKSELYLNESEPYISESDFELCGALGDSHASLRVVGFKKARQALAATEDRG